MCFSQGMSAAIALSGFALAAYEHYTMKCPQYTLGVVFYASMELLQAVQYSYIAEPDDGYAMCGNRTNQALTVLAGVHICFQPLFTNILFSSFFRTKSIQDRIESDLIRRLSIFLAFWYGSSYFMATSRMNDNTHDTFANATPECPNYDWTREGFDGYLNATTPNLPGHSCTFRPNTDTGHLAWVLPQYGKHTYFMPGGCLHFFLFFAPYIMSRRFCLQRMGIMMLAAGPYLVAQMTPSINEQPAIWCFLSIFEIAFLSVRARMCGYITEPIPERLVHLGGLGEQPLEYVYVTSDNNDSKWASNPGSQELRAANQDDKARGWQSWMSRDLGLQITIHKVKEI